MAWLWRTKPLFPLPLALLPAKRLSYEAAPGYGAASSSPAAPLRDETLWMILLSYTPARWGWGWPALGPVVATARGSCPGRVTPQSKALRVERLKAIRLCAAGPTEIPKPPSLTRMPPTLWDTLLPITFDQLTPSRWIPSPQSSASVSELGQAESGGRLVL